MATTPLRVALTLLACVAVSAAAAAADTPNPAEDNYIVLLKPSTRPWRSRASAWNAPRATWNANDLRSSHDDDADDADDATIMAAIKGCLASLRRRAAEDGAPHHEPPVVRVLRRAVRGAVLKLNPSEAEALTKRADWKSQNQSQNTTKNQKNQTDHHQTRDDCGLAGDAILDVERDAVVTAQGFRVSSPRGSGGIGGGIGGVGGAVSAQGGLHGGG
jgi:hypothetical protein